MFGEKNREKGGINTKVHAAFALRGTISSLRKGGGVKGQGVVLRLFCTKREHSFLRKREEKFMRSEDCLANLTTHKLERECRTAKKKKSPLPLRNKGSRKGEGKRGAKGKKVKGSFNFHTPSPGCGEMDKDAGGCLSEEDRGAPIEKGGNGQK